MTDRLDHLVARLKPLGFECAHREPDQVVLRRVEDDASYILTASDTWISAMQPLIEAGALAASKHTPAAFRFVLELHSRYMGCRIGFDEDENLCVQYDIYPDMSAEHVGLALTQMAYIAAATAPLFEVVLAGGVVDDHLIDRAFGADDGADDN